jgi:hypothetical protein
MLSRASGIARRWVTVLVTIVAWLALSNHCVLGRALDSATRADQSEASGCPMHSAPAKKKPATKTPCCKDVRAVIAKSVAANPIAVRLIGTRDYITAIFPEPARIATELGSLDTGPPDLLSFAESVLQESMLSHAPPVS